MFCEERETIPPRNADNLQSPTSDSGSNNVARDTNTRPSVEERLVGKMFSYAREITCFFLAFTFTVLAALHSSPPIISKPPPAAPFFHQNSIVLDFYKGHLGAMIEQVTDADFSFIMYYAPWDAESQLVRQEFEKVVQYYHSQIFFAAINCWRPNSECRAQYNKIQSYPVLILYPSRDSGIEYKGIRTAPYMTRFLSAFINPIERIVNKEQLMHLLVNYDAVVIGYFNFSGLSHSPGYREFYKAAIRSLERDPNRELIFAAVTDVISSELDYGIINFPAATLLMWNESFSYPEDRDWTTDNILSWVSSSIHQPALWLQPPGIKSLTLAPYLKEGPVLFVFTPRNPLHSENYNYNLMREVGLQYYNCADNLMVKDVITHLKHYRLTAVKRHLQKTKRCVEILNESKSQLREPPVSISIQQWINNSCCAKVVMNKCLLCKKKIHLMKKETAFCASIFEKFDSVCKDVDIFNVPAIEDDYEKYEFCCSEGHATAQIHRELKSKRHKTPVLIEEKDPQSAEVVRRAFLKDDCKRWTMGNDYHQPIFPHSVENRSTLNFTNSVCKTNKTLALIAIDSLHYFHFAEGLGIDVLNRRDKTAVVILDAAQESQYVMQQDFSQYALIEFINAYTEGSLKRSLRSNNPGRFAQKVKTRTYRTQENVKRVYIPELTTKTFLSTILDPSKDVVVMYHSPYCAFCSAISYVYLTVAHYLFEMDHLLLVRVDGDNNDLKWEYNMNRFPSILFFPAKRKEDSTVYPFSLPITIPNLLNFILVNLEPDAHVEALTNICHFGAGEYPDNCIARIRWLCLDIIEQLLKDYRRLRRHLNFLHKRTARNKRKMILLKLEHIRDIHFILGSTVDLTEDLYKVQLIRKKFKQYYRLIQLIEVDNQINSSKIESPDINPRSDARKLKVDRSEL